MKHLFLAACAALMAVGCSGPTPTYAGCVTGAEPECPVIERGHLTVSTNFAGTVFRMNYGGDGDPPLRRGLTIQPGVPLELNLRVGSYDWTAEANGAEKSGRVTIEQDSSVGITLTFEVQFAEVMVRASVCGDVFLDGANLGVRVHDEGSVVQVPQNGMTHTLEARDVGLVNRVATLTPSDMPSSVFIKQAADMNGRECVGTEGWDTGLTVTITMDVEVPDGSIYICLDKGADGVEPDCWEIEGYDMSYSDERVTLTGGVSEDRCIIDITTEVVDSRPRRDAYDCCP